VGDLPEWVGFRSPSLHVESCSGCDPVGPTCASTLVYVLRAKRIYHVRSVTGSRSIIGH